MRPTNLNRTVTFYKYNVTVMNKDTEEIYKKEVEVTRPTDKEVKNKLAENEQLLYIHSKEKTTKVYTMPIDRFVELADVVEQ